MNYTTVRDMCMKPIIHYTKPISYSTIAYSCVVNTNFNGVLKLYVQMDLYRNKGYHSNVYTIILETNQNVNHK